MTGEADTVLSNTVLVMVGPEVDNVDLSPAAWVEQDWRDLGVVAFSVPGRGTAPPPTGGVHDLMDPAFDAARFLAQNGSAEPERRLRLVLGVGSAGWSAQVLGLGGHAEAVAVVDGLGGPWLDPADRARTRRAWHRELVADAGLAGDYPTTVAADPRLAVAPATHGIRLLAEDAVRHMPVPHWVGETPASTTPTGDVRELTIVAAAATRFIAVSDATARGVFDSLSDWLFPGGRNPRAGL